MSSSLRWRKSESSSQYFSLSENGTLLILLSTYSLSMTYHLNKVQDNKQTKRDNLITRFNETMVSCTNAYKIFDFEDLPLKNEHS